MEMTGLHIHHLRFTCEAITPLHLGGRRAGSNLRGALGRVMRRAVCPEARHAGKPAPDHAAICPACWLLAAEVESGEVRRAYALAPPLGAPEVFQPGERYTFGLTLFGQALRFLPYFVLAVPEAGREGVGRGRGRFALCAISAHDPLSGRVESVLAEGEGLVHVPSLAVTAQAVEAASKAMIGRIERGLVRLRFLTPTRLTLGGEDRLLAKAPDFGVLFARLLDRLEELGRQFGTGSPPEGGMWEPDDVHALRLMADRVRLVEADARWVEVASGSTRTGRPTFLSGFAGGAAYHSWDWEALLPWLVWGQATQVGKDVVKGNGLYEIEAPAARRYARWLSDPLPARASAGD